MKSLLCLVGRVMIDGWMGFKLNALAAELISAVCGHICESIRLVGGVEFEVSPPLRLLALQVLPVTE